MHVRIDSTSRFTALPDGETLAETVAALERRGFGVEVVEDLDAAREAVLARIPHGSSVMTNPSVTLQETGIAQAINEWFNVAITLAPILEGYSQSLMYVAQEHATNDAEQAVRAGQLADRLGGPQ